MDVRDLLDKARQIAHTQEYDARALMSCIVEAHKMGMINVVLDYAISVWRRQSPQLALLNNSSRFGVWCVVKRDGQLIWSHAMASLWFGYAGLYESISARIKEVASQGLIRLPDTWVTINDFAYKPHMRPLREGIEVSVDGVGRVVFKMQHNRTRTAISFQVPDTRRKRCFNTLTLRFPECADTSRWNAGRLLGDQWWAMDAIEEIVQMGLVKAYYECDLAQEWTPELRGLLKLYVWQSNGSDPTVGIRQSDDFMERGSLRSMTYRPSFARTPGFSMCRGAHLASESVQESLRKQGYRSQTDCLMSEKGVKGQSWVKMSDYVVSQMGQVEMARVPFSSVNTFSA